MTTTESPQTWENLLHLAAVETYPADALQLELDARALAEAYDYCEQLTAEHSRSFYTASALLPASRRAAARALYAFCRVSDDIVDESADADTASRLAAWQQRALMAYPPPTDPVAMAWADTRHRFAVPVRYIEQLIHGVERDLHQTRYDTFEQLANYCYGVASTVGLMSMHIIGFAGPEARYYAIKLGVALQLTNILRDVGEDWQKGRLYLPQEEMAAYGLDEDDIARGQVDHRWRAFMRFQIARNRQLYREAWPGIRLLDRRGRLAIAAAATIYAAILDDIEAHGYDVFNRRAYVGRLGKLRALAVAWWRL